MSLWSQFKFELKLCAKLFSAALFVDKDKSCSFPQFSSMHLLPYLLASLLFTSWLVQFICLVPSFRFFNYIFFETSLRLDFFFFFFLTIIFIVCLFQSYFLFSPLSHALCSSTKVVNCHIGLANYLCQTLVRISR